MHFAWSDLQRYADIGFSVLSTRHARKSHVVTLRVPWVPEVFSLTADENSSLTARAAKPREKRAGHNGGMTDTGNCARKTSGTQGTLRETKKCYCGRFYMLFSGRKIKLK